jgi:hypothetical protein
MAKADDGGEPRWVAKENAPLSAAGKRSSKVACRNKTARTGQQEGVILNMDNCITANKINISRPHDCHSGQAA